MSNRNRARGGMEWRRTIETGKVYRPCESKKRGMSSVCSGGKLVANTLGVGVTRADDGSRVGVVEELSSRSSNDGPSLTDDLSTSGDEDGVADDVGTSVEEDDLAASVL